jgi:hypothetical protein
MLGAGVITWARENLAFLEQLPCFEFVIPKKDGGCCVQWNDLVKGWVDLERWLETNSNQSNTRKNSDLQRQEDVVDCSD